VYIHIDEESYRIVASAKVDKFIQPADNNIKVGDAVELLVWQKTPLGFKVIVDNAFQGLIYDNQIFQYVHTGDKLQGYVTNVRPDGKIDCSLQAGGRKETLEFSDELLQYIQQHDGYCALGDKSDPEDIKRLFHVSKKVFKKAIGDLYKKHAITIEEDGLHLASHAL
jgi:predicted RNA-binding protein (virulence factor B family)